MPSVRLIPSLLLLALASCAPLPSTSSVATPRAPSDPEIAAIGRAVALTYELTGFDDASTASAEVFSRAFTPKATLSSARDGKLTVRSIDEYVETRRRMLASGRVQSLHERELKGVTQYFGNVAQHLSSYEVFINKGATPSERGVMSFQLVKVEGRWLVQSLMWHAETAETPIPAELLP